MDRPTPQERKDATAQLRERHQPTFDALGIPEAKYIPKMAHHVSGLSGLYMGFFESELNDGQDVYTEKVSIQMESEDPSRTLYKYRYNPHFKSELPTSDHTISVSTRFFIPMDEFEEVARPVPVLKKSGRHGKRGPYKKKAKEVVIPELIQTVRTIIVDSTEDLPMEAMTIRDYIAIHTGNPVSSKTWINQIVTKEKV